MASLFFSLPLSKGSIFGGGDCDKLCKLLTRLFNSSKAAKLLMEGKIKGWQGGGEWIVMNNSFD